MKDNEIYKAAKTEADWLRYYAHRKERDECVYDNCEFYDKIPSIGYAKVVTPLAQRCAMMYVTGLQLVTDCKLNQLAIVSGPRNHSMNVYTPLEYFLASKNVPQDIKDELIRIIRHEI